MEATRARTGFIGIAIALVLFVSNLSAEGFHWSKDKKRLLEPHSWLKLTAKQRQEIKWRSVITLTSSQLKVLRKIEPTAHNKVENMSSDWDLCTCCVGQCIIVFPSGKVAVPHEYLGRKSLLVDEGLPMRGKIGPILHVDIRSDGKFTYDGSEISFAKMCTGQPVIVEGPDGFDSDDSKAKAFEVFDKLESWGDKENIEIVMIASGTP